MYKTPVSTGLLLALALSACSGGAQSLPGTGALTQQSAAVDRSTDVIDSTGSCGTSQVYVADVVKNTVFIYPQGVPNPKPCGKIINNVHSPEGITVDAKGWISVANYGNSTITEYTHYKKQSVVTINTAAPAYDVFAGKNLELYVAMPSINTVAEYQGHSTTLIQNLTINGAPYGVATDSHNNLYVSYLSNADGMSHVEKFGPGQAKGIDTPIVLPFSGELKLDTSNNVIIGDRNNNDKIFIYPPGSGTASSSFATAANPVYFSLDNAEAFIYISAIGSVQVLHYPSGAPEQTMQSGLASPSGIATYPAAPL